MNYVLMAMPGGPKRRSIWAQGGSHRKPPPGEWPGRPLPPWREETAERRVANVTEQPMADEMEEHPLSEAEIEEEEPWDQAILDEGDYWEVKPSCVIRHHRIARHAMYAPRQWGCPVSLEELRPERKTIIVLENGEKAEEINDWTDPATARIHVGQLWTGCSIFYLRSTYPRDCDEVLLMDEPQAAQPDTDVFLEIDHIHQAYQEEANPELDEVEQVGDGSHVR